MSFLSNLFRKQRDPREDLRPLWHRTVELARERELYATCGVADSVAGRFDAITAVLALILLRMERVPELIPPSALLTELFVDDMDGQMRQSGVGDVVVGKHMGKVMGTMGGRLGAYRDAMADGAEDNALTEAVERNVTLTEGGDAACVAQRMCALGERLKQTSDDALLAGDIAA